MSRHVMVEFSFDVARSRRPPCAPEAYYIFVGFQVSKPLLEPAFKETRVTWGKKRAEILKVVRGAKKERAVQPASLGLREGISAPNSQVFGNDARGRTPVPRQLHEHETARRAPREAGCMNRSTTLLVLTVALALYGPYSAGYDWR
jgi:hypothetical protein